MNTVKCTNCNHENKNTNIKCESCGIELKQINSDTKIIYLGEKN